MKKVNYPRLGWRLLLAILCLTATTAFADVEPNNTIATAEHAPFGVAVSGSLNQAPVGDGLDYYLKFRS